MQALRVLGIALLILGFAATAQAGTRLYTGSLTIHAFGNDTSTGTAAPFTSESWTAIPFGSNNCDIRQWPSLPTSAPCSLGTHPNTCPKPAETKMFTFMNHTGSVASSGTNTFTLPQYGGQPALFDTTSPSCTLTAGGCTDGIPDVACLDTTIKNGVPMAGGGTAGTAGSGLLAFSLPAANPTTGAVTTGLSQASSHGQFVPVIPPYQFSVLYGDLRNQLGSFGKGYGPGNFSFTNLQGIAGTMKGTAGANRFGGTMRLLGHYYTNEGYIFGGHLSVAHYTWLFQEIGGAGNIIGTPNTAGTGHVQTGPGVVAATNMLWTTMAGAEATSDVSAVVVPWTTGTVTVIATRGPNPTVLQRKGYDNRNSTGAGTIQLVSPMLTRWTWDNGQYETGSVGILNLVFAPEPQAWMMLVVGAGSLGFLYRSNRRRS